MSVYVVCMCVQVCMSDRCEYECVVACVYIVCVYVGVCVCGMIEFSSPKTYCSLVRSSGNSVCQLNTGIENLQTEHLM